MKKITLTILFILLVAVGFTQVNKQVLQLMDTSKVFISNKLIGDLVTVTDRKYSNYIFKLNHTVPAMKTLGYALRQGWCDTIGKDRAGNYWTKVGNKLYTATNDSVGIGKIPTRKFEVDGEIRATTTGVKYAVSGYATGSGYAIYGNSVSGYAINGTSSGSIGVRGSSSADYGVYGSTSSGSYAGVKGTATNGGRAIDGYAQNGIGVKAVSETNDAIYAQSYTGYAGNFKGRLITDTLIIDNYILGDVKVKGTYSTGTVAKVTIDTVSAIRLLGNSTVWKDVEGSFSTGLNGGSAYPTYVVDSGYYTFTVDTTAPTICKQYFPSIQINHEFKLGATVYPHVHYKYETAKGTPTFIVKYRWKNIGSAPTAWRWCKMPNTTGTTNGTMQLAYSANGISAVDNNVSAILQAQVYLYSQTGTGGINAYSFDLHGEVDSIGSNSEINKD
jgi:hypothetical protein